MGMLAVASLVAILALGALAPAVVAQTDGARGCVTFSDDITGLSPDEVAAAIEAGIITIEAVADPAACGTTPTDPAPPTPAPGATPLPDFIEPDEYDVCYLVTDAEVETIMHRRLMDGTSYGTNAGGIHDCTYMLYLDPLEMVSVSYFDDADAEGGGWASGDRVSGIGDKAYWFADQQLWVGHGDRSIAVLVYSETVDPFTAAKEIAEIALSRLPER
jgi:hypothetical protein